MKWLIRITVILASALFLQAQTPSMESISIQRTETSNGTKRVVYWVYDSTLPQPPDKVEITKDEKGVEIKKVTPVPRPYANGSVTVSAKLTDEQVENEVVKDAEQVFAAWLAQRNAVAPTVTTNATPTAYDSAKIKVIKARLIAKPVVVIEPEP